MISDATFNELLVVWLIVATVTVVAHHRRNRAAAGLVLSWLLNIGLIHWLPASVYALPWYVSVDPELTQQGFVESLYAVAAFGTGVLVIAPFLQFLGPRVAANPTRPASFGATPTIWSYLIAGSLAYFVIERLVGSIPTIAGVVSTGLSIVVAGLCLGCARAVQARQDRKLAGWLLFSVIYPVGTIVTQGFLGFGAFTVVSVASFVAVSYRSRFRSVLVAFLVAYLSLSVYVTYMRDRELIRGSVWGGASFSARFNEVYLSAITFELFDPTNSDHLARVDERLNQDRLVGTAVRYIEQGNHDFANGQTIRDAVIAVVPRAIWPDKPVIAGSGNLVSTYTGLNFDFTTSVGIGQVMEFYINFGTVGIVGGFLLFGALIGALDRGAGEALARGDVPGFTYRYIPALAFMTVGGSLVELTSSIAASLVLAVLLNHFVLPTLLRERERRRSRRISELSAADRSTFVSVVSIERRG